jgi:NAD-reducing hydrogenase small subunit
MSKLRMATVWLDGCSGCHMSFLDLDERLLELAEKVELVYSPLVDLKEYPEQVDLALVEGAVSSEEDLEKIKKIRKHTKFLITLGDCAITGNVPAMRNPHPLPGVLDRAYFENAAANQQVPTQVVPRLLERVRPVHEVVKVDLFVPGCPPSADTIYFALTELLAGRVPALGDKTRFGA